MPPDFMNQAMHQQMPQMGPAMSPQPQPMAPSLTALNAMPPPPGNLPLGAFDLPSPAGPPLNPGAGQINPQMAPQQMPQQFPAQMPPQQMPQPLPFPPQPPQPPQPQPAPQQQAPAGFGHTYQQQQAQAQQQPGVVGGYNFNNPVAQPVQPVAGYGVVAPVQDPNPRIPTGNATIDAVEGLSNDQAMQMKNYIAMHKLSKEASDDFVNMAKKQIADQNESIAKGQIDRKQAVAEQKTKWHNEVISHPEFGGNNIRQTYSHVQQVLDQFFPEMKKEIDQTGGMIPSYFMLGLARTGKAAFPQAGFQNGAPMGAAGANNLSGDMLGASMY